MSSKKQFPCNTPLYWLQHHAWEPLFLQIKRRCQNFCFCFKFAFKQQCAWDYIYFQLQTIVLIMFSNTFYFNLWILKKRLLYWELTLTWWIIMGIILGHYRVTSLSQFAGTFLFSALKSHILGNPSVLSTWGQLTTLKQADIKGECGWIGF